MPRSSAAKKRAAAPIVLSVGRSGRLLKTRNQVLHKAGFEVLSATSRARAVAQASRRAPDVVVIGHRISAEERIDIISRTKLIAPSALVVLLYSQQIERAELAHAILDVDGGPENLVQTIWYLFANKGAHARKAFRAPS